MKKSFSFIFCLFISLSQLAHFGKAVDNNEITPEKKSKIELPSIQHSIWAWNENLPAQHKKRNTTQTSTVPIAATVLTTDSEVTIETQTKNSNWNENSDPNEIQFIPQKPFDSNNLKPDSNLDVGALPVDYLPNVGESHPMISLNPETPDNSNSLAVDSGSRRSNPWNIYPGNVPPVIYQKPGTNPWNIHPIYRPVPTNPNPQIRPWNTYQGYPPPMHPRPMYPWGYPEYGPSGGYPEYGPSGNYPEYSPPLGYPEMSPWYPYPIKPFPQPEGWNPSSEPYRTTTTTTSTTTPAPTTAPPTTAPPTTAPPTPPTTPPATTPPATTPPATTPPATTPPATTPPATAPPATTPLTTSAPPMTTAPPTTTTTTTTMGPTYQPEPEPEWIFWPHWPPRPDGGYPAGGYPRPPPPRPDGGKPNGWPMPSYGPQN